MFGNVYKDSPKKSKHLFLESVVALWEFKSNLPVAILLSLVAKLLRDSTLGGSFG